LLIVLESIGIVAFAFVGAVDAVRARLDLFGTAVAAMITAIGGGVLRDILLGDHPPLGLRTWWYFVAGLATALFVFCCYPRVTRLTVPVQFADAIGLAMFSMTGALKSVQHGAPLCTAALIGMVNAIGGGMIREMLLGRIPLVMRKEIYALPALGGALLVACGHLLKVSAQVTTPVVIVLVVAVRMLALRLNWNLAVARLERRPRRRRPPGAWGRYDGWNEPTVELPVPGGGQPRQAGDPVPPRERSGQVNAPGYRWHGGGDQRNGTCFPPRQRLRR
jgi:uncharacterized membrane protein YeiH